jgi:hypothetical protein
VGKTSIGGALAVDIRVLNILLLAIGMGSFLPENQISAVCKYYESISVFKKPEISSKFRPNFDGFIA